MKEERRQFLIILALLSLPTLICFWPVLQYPFVILDDFHYLQENSNFTAGLSWSSLGWAFKTNYFCNWHPLTWVSYFFDESLYGLKPGGYHLTNLILHMADTVLLFILFKEMTGRIWPSVMVACLFAWHPLHVESVVWVSERKDVLSALFWILTTIAYSRYVQSRSPNAQGRTQANHWVYYAWSLVFFSCGLMSKAMLVTLPCVLLLLDYWPFRRFTNLADVWRLMLEKVPFFLLAIITGVVTFIVQNAGGAVASLGANPFSFRLSNAILAYGKYISKTLWPVNLSVMYPFPDHLYLGLAIGVAALLLILTGFFLSKSRSHPFLIVGWLWFIGTLVPVIGLVQVGAQAMADRYMYIPGIGLFLIIVWGLDGLLSSQPYKRQLLVGGSIAASVGCLVCTSLQVRYWQDSEHLFGNALKIDPENYLAYDGLGKALEDAGRKEEALRLYSYSVRHPNYDQGHYNYGTLLMEVGRTDEAVVELNQAIKANPKSNQAHHNLGNAYIRLGKLPEATMELSKVVDLKPRSATARNDLASVLLTQSRFDEANRQLEKALQLDPDFAEAHRNLGVASIRQGKTNDAVLHFTRAVQLAPKNPEMRFNLGLVYMDQNRPADAAPQFAEGAKLKPNDPWMHYRLASALVRLHESKRALAEYLEAIKLAPSFPDALNDLAWLLASDPSPEIRSGEDAIQLAQRACEITTNQQPALLRTLAAAYAEAGRFPDAVITAQKARDLSLASGEKEAAAKAEEFARLYQSHQPFHQQF